MNNRSLVLAFIAALMFVAAPPLTAQRKHTNTVIDIWMQGKPAFGVFVPNENAPQRPPGGGGAAPGGVGQPGRGAPPGVAGGKPTPGTAQPQTPRPRPLYTREGGERLVMNPLYDYVFLNLEGSY